MRTGEIVGGHEPFPVKSPLTVDSDRTGVNDIDSGKVDDSVSSQRCCRTTSGAPGKKNCQSRKHKQVAKEHCTDCNFPALGTLRSPKFATFMPIMESILAGVNFFAPY